MLAAIGILLILQQIPVALGAPEESTLASLVTGGAFSVSLPAITVSAVGLFVLWFWSTPTLKRIKALSWMRGRWWRC